MGYDSGGEENVPPLRCVCVCVHFCLLVRVNRAVEGLVAPFREFLAVRHGSGLRCAYRRMRL